MSDEQLLANHVHGDAAAFADLVGRYQQELFAFLQRFVADTSVAEDLFQETFAQVHRSARSFDPQRRFRPWLFTIAANKGRDYLRSSGRHTVASLDNVTATGEAMTFLDLLEAPGPSPTEDLGAAEDIARVQSILAAMPGLYKEVLLLSYFHQFAYKQIAEMLGIPLGTVKSRLHAALAMFAKRWQGAPADEKVAGARRKGN